MVADNLMRRYALPTRVIYPALSDDKFKVLDQLPLPSNPNEDSAREQDLIKKGFDNKDLEILSSFKKPTLSQAMTATKNVELKKLKDLQFSLNSELPTLTRERENIKAKTYAQEDLNSIRSGVYNLALNLGAEPRIADNFSTAADWTPIIGDFSGFEDAVINYKNGNYGAATFDAVLATIGLAPIAGDILKRILQNSRKIKSKDPYYDSTEELDNGINLKLIAGTNISDPNTLKKLEEFEIKRRTVDKISEQNNTGWTIHPVTKRPIFEISDAEATVNHKFITGPVLKKSDLFKQSTDMDKVTTLQEIFKHKELYKLYPELKNMRVVVNKTLPKGVVGSFQQTAMYGPILTIAPYKEIGRFKNIKNIDNPDEITNIDFAVENVLEEYKKTILHEVQHAIQQIEKFPKGDNMDSSGSKFMDWFDSLPSSERNEIQFPVADQMGSEFVSDISSSRLPESLKVYFYKNTSGEIEARVAEASHKLTQEQLKDMSFIDRFETQKNIAKKEAGEELEIFEGYAYPTKGEEIADIKQRDSIYPNFNLPTSDIKVIKKFIKKSFKKIPGLKHLSSIKKGDTIKYKNQDYIFEEFVEGSWDSDKDFTFQSNLILNPIKNYSGVSSIYDEGPMARLRLKSSSDKSLKSIEEFQESIKVPVLYLKNNSFNLKSQNILRNELLKLNKPGLMSRIFKKD